MNSETRMPALLSSVDEAAQVVVAAHDVEPALRRALLALLGHEAAGMRHVPQRDRQHLLGCRHLEIERPRQLALEARDVVIGDMAPILAQVRGDAVGAGLDGQVGGPHRIGMAAAARVADGGHVIDVDAEAQVRRASRVGRFVGFMGTRRAIGSDGEYIQNARVKHPLRRQRG